MKIEEKFEDIYVVGDIHGEIRKLVNDITYKYKLKNSIFIIAGDCGFGFESKKYYDLLYWRKTIHKRLSENNNLILCVRGNHDDPDYFIKTSDKYINYFPNLKFIEDYEVIEFKNIKILCIGGATSIDQIDRKEYNDKQVKCGSLKRCWWENEKPIKIDLNELPSKIDVIISHEAPIQFCPLIYRDKNMSLEIYNSILDDRNYLGNIFLTLYPKYWFFGHYHRSYSDSFRQTLIRGLDIEELIKIKNYD